MAQKHFSLIYGDLRGKPIDALSPRRPKVVAQITRLWILRVFRPESIALVALKQKLVFSCVFSRLYKKRGASVLLSLCSRSPDHPISQATDIRGPREPSSKGQEDKVPDWTSLLYQQWERQGCGAASRHLGRCPSPPYLR